MDSHLECRNAKALHGFFHQNAHTLQKQFQLTATEAREIVESCDDCHALGAPLPAGVNPRGLKALELWQTDVTQVAEFGRLKYVHVMVDTFSSAMWASAHTGEKARDVIAHWRQAFAVLGIPSAVKTDNGPAYASQQVRQFLQSWGVSHNFGIPHSPTGQAIVEHNHGTLKRVLQKQKRGMQGETPNSRLAKALYTINHLTVPQNSNNPVILNHHLSLQASDGEQQPRAKTIGKHPPQEGQNCSGVLEVLMTIVRQMRGTSDRLLDQVRGAQWLVSLMTVCGSGRFPWSMERWNCPQPWCHREGNLGAESTVMSQRGEHWGCATPGPAPRALAAPGGDTKAELGGRQQDHGVQAPSLHRQPNSGSLGIPLEQCPKAPGAAAASEL
ncbi:hypothetical protein DUI87_06352 [Hirundo rustica rustica]|uniref:RNA-directed DNA polymerase n=1 Tax=Hirundo rustica rustica TaxID=333673 RepID=A0A3M0KU62_HIRRU|nr:hypothetical protein DUI87_06352 [Hirundo rustica rustica]